MKQSNFYAAPVKRLLFFRSLNQIKPGFHYSIGIQGEALNALFHKPPRQVRMVGWALSTNTNVFSRPTACLYGQPQESLYGWIALIEGFCDKAGIPIQSRV